MRAAAIQPADVERFWLLFEPHIARVCRYSGAYAPESVLRKILNCDAQLWGIFQGDQVIGACVTEIVQKDLYTSCNLWLCAGSYSDAARDCLLREVEDWARRIGCERIELVGRRGWEKKLPSYRRTRVILEKRL